MTISQLRLLPPGPEEAYNPAEDLLSWIERNFARYGDLYKASVSGSQVFVVSSPEYVERILRQNWLNYERNGLAVKRIALSLGKNIITSNGEFWARQRRMMQPAFTKKAVANLVDVFTSASTDLLENWKRAAVDKETVNVTRDVSRMVLKITLISIFGDDYGAAAPHFEFFAEEASRDLGFAGELVALRKLVLLIAEQRRREGRVSETDSLGMLMGARDRHGGEPMEDAQLAREIVNLVVAGHETTASLLNWMWYLLAEHPDVQTKLADELTRLPWGKTPAIDNLPKYTYTRQVIDEALRLYPPLWLMTRKALNDDHLGEFFVPKGTEIFISPYLIQRSPLLWDLPDRFDPGRMSPESGQDRHELALCPFGAGPRNCMGEYFARVETQIHLMMIAEQLSLSPVTQDLPKASAAGLNLVSVHDVTMLPEIRAKSTASFS